MTNFDQAIEVTLYFEGGYSNNPDDPGGETNFGISKKQYPELDIKNLTVDEAKKIYYLDYWVPHMFEEISNLIVATKMFDMAVNLGPSRSIVTAQSAFNGLTSTSRLVLDGLMGQDTIEALNTLPDTYVGAYMMVVQSKLNAYRQRLVSDNPKLSVFINGWSRRDMWPYLKNVWPYLPVA